jgi:hypothetical protein
MRWRGRAAYRTRGAIAFVIAAFVPGCGKSHISECNVLGETLNRGTPRLELVRELAAQRDTHGLIALSAELDAIASDAAAIPLAIPELARLSAKYQEIMKTVAIAARARAATKEPVASSNAALDVALGQEVPIVIEMARACAE